MNYKNKLISFLFLILLLILGGCGYSMRPLLGMDLRTIAIENLENKTYEHSLEVLVTESVRDEFIFDGTLKVVGEAQAALKLSGAVINYTFDPLSYSEADKAESYRLKIRTRLTLENLKEKKFIWQDKIIEGDAHYLLVGSLALTETEARDRALKDLARKILRQTIDIW